MNQSANEVDLVIRNAPAGGWTVHNHEGTVAAFSTLVEMCNWLEVTFPDKRTEQEPDSDTRRIAERLPPPVPVAADDDNVMPLRKVAGILPWSR